MPAGYRTSQDAIELELIRSLSAGLVPSLIMTFGFAISGALIVWTERDPLLLALLVGGIIASAARIGAALRLPRRDRPADVTLERAQRLENEFRVGYLAFAVMLGLFGLRAFMLDNPHVHILMLCLLMGYAAGVAATIALRPWIAIPSMLIALSPMIVAVIVRMEPIYVATGLMTMALVAGGIQNLRMRHTHIVEEIALRIAFGNIARKDSLTALPNRIALREWFHERSQRTSAGGLIAVHYLDLDGFKPINDRFGHAFGDALLAAVGKRIGSAIRDTDLAARLGGDEFAIVQFGIESEDAAQQLAKRLIAAITRPFHIEDRIVDVAASVGYAITERDTGDLEELLIFADQALYASKRQGGGITRHGPGIGQALNAA